MNDFDRYMQRIKTEYASPSLSKSRRGESSGATSRDYQWMLLLTSPECSLREFTSLDEAMKNETITSEEEKTWEEDLRPLLRQRLLYSLCLTAFREDSRFAKWCLQTQFPSMFSPEKSEEEDIDLTIQLATGESHEDSEE